MEKPNQDALLVKSQVGSDPDTAFFAVFDGHGTAGTECANFARDKASALFTSASHLLDRAVMSYHLAA